MTISASSWRPDDLFGVASRRNPRRGFMLLSRVLGRHLPSQPRLMRAAFSELAEAVVKGPLAAMDAPLNAPLDTPPGAPIVVVALAETAVGLGAGVHQCLLQQQQNPVLFLCTTRHELETELLAAFEEPHSHARRHLIHTPTNPAHHQLLKQAQALVVVDDELTTGRTMSNLVASLRPAMPALRHVTAASLMDFAAPLAEIDTRISLLRGQLNWQSDPVAGVDVVPEVDITAAGQWQPTVEQNWGRCGVTKSVAHTLSPSVQQGRRTLVLGTGEFVWQPFLLAEQLEQGGEQVAFAATTRSPIRPGAEVTDIIQCRDNYGFGIPNFAYNCRNDDWQRVLICCETPAEMVDAQLVAAFAEDIDVEVLSFA